MKTKLILCLMPLFILGCGDKPEPLSKHFDYMNSAERRVEYEKQMKNRERLREADEKIINDLDNKKRQGL